MKNHFTGRIALRNDPGDTRFIQHHKSANFLYLGRNLNYPIAMEAIRRRKHVYIEKPLCRCITEVRALQAEKELLLTALLGDGWREQRNVAAASASAQV